MSSQKQIYFERKSKVLECLYEAETFLLENGFEDEQQSVAAQYSNVENGDFTIAVVGEFSAGKSTFLNALMGEKLLPSFSRETTATINFLRHKEKAEPGVEGSVYYNDGTVKNLEKIDNQTIEKYVCTRSEEDVASNISHFDLFLENRFLKDNVTLVDTPGLNGIKEGHEEITEKQIEKSSASIFLFNANQPGSKTDFQALQMLRKRVKSIFLVLNRIDEIKTDEHETPDDVINTLKDKYKKDYPEEERIPEFFPVSAYKALLARSKQNLFYHDRNDFTDAEKERFELESGMYEFEEKLWKFLTEGEKGRQMLISPVVQLNGILEDVMNFLHEQKNVLEGTYDSEELKQRIAELKQASAELQKKIDSKSNEIYFHVKDAEEEFFEEVESEVVQYRNVYLRKIENFSSLEEINPDNITKNVNDKFSFILSEAYRNYGRRIEEIMASDNTAISSELRELIKQNKSISVDGPAELTCFDTELDKFENRIESMRNEIEELGNKLDDQEITVHNQRKLEREIKKIEKKIESAEEGKRWYLQNAMTVLPSRRARTVDVIKYQERNGVLGKLVDSIIGQKSYISTETVYDSTEYDEYKKIMDQHTSEYDSDISSYRAEKSRLGNVDAEAAELKLEQMESNIQKKREAMIEYEKKAAEEIKEKYAKQLKIQKSEVSQYIESKVSEFISFSRDVFDESRDSQIESMKILIAAPLQEQLKLSEEQVSILVKQIESSESERNENLSRVCGQIEKLRPLIEKSLDLKDELESIEVDYIREVEL